MKLKDYFLESRNSILSEQEKFFVYQKILNKQYLHKPKLQIFAWKYTKYVTIVAVMLFFVYGVYFISDSQINKISDGFLVQNVSEQNRVQADWIAQVIEFQGDFIIKHGDQKVQASSNIQDNDTVILQKNTEIVFQINDGSQAKIIGPAEFTINQISYDKYQINLREGSFVHIQSINDYQSNLELLVEEENLSVYATSKYVNFLLSKTDNEYKINNQGKKLLITHNNEDLDLESQKLVALNDIANIQDAKSFSDAVINKDLSQTFTFNELDNELEVEEEKINTEESEIVEEENIVVLVENNQVIDTLSTDDIVVDVVDDNKNIEIDEYMYKLIAQIETADEVILSDKEKTNIEELGLELGKNVPSPEQTQTLSDTLNKFFIRNNVDKIAEYYYGDQQNLFDNHFGKLNDKFLQLYTVFNLSYTQPNGDSDAKLDILETNVKFLYNHLNQNYYIPNNFLYVLEDLPVWLSVIQVQDIVK